MANERYGIFYLKTGGGHYSGAKSIAEKLKTLDPNASFVLCDGFDNSPAGVRFFFETGYSVTANHFPLGFTLFYQLTNFPKVQSLLYKRFSSVVRTHVRRQIVQGQFTKIVCTHEIISPIIKRVCDELKLSIPVVSVVMDPFTAPSIWFFEKDMKLIVFSEYLKKQAVEKYGVPAKNIFKAAPIFSEKFSAPLPETEKRELKQSFGIPQDKKVLLIAGGGEGLKGADKILSVFLKNNFDEQIIIVCGKNKVLKQKLEKIVQKHKAENVLIFGFVTIMYELINLADCVVSKGGPGTVMEVLSLKKPLIISDFIRHQEWGNVFFVQQNNAGFLIPKPKDIHKKVMELFSGETMPPKPYEITNGLPMIAEYIHNL